VESRRREHDLVAARAISWQRSVQQVAVWLAAALLLLWTVLPFVWLKNPGRIILVPPKFVFEPTSTTIRRW